ncbi:MAG: hypothetical protein ABEH40_08025 [Haloferacaceae archaeon]
MTGPGRTRGQATLLATAVAVVVLVGATALGVAMADGALGDADRRPLERRAATTLAERLTTANATTHRDGVVDPARVRNLTGADLERIAPPVRGRDARVAIDGRTAVTTGGVGADTTVRRAVRVGRASDVRRRIDLDARRNLTVPAGVGRVRVHVTTGENTTVPTVRADGRPVLHAGSGVEGRATVALGRHDPTRLRFAVETELRNGTVTARARVSYVRVTTRPAVLEVTVDG